MVAILLKNLGVDGCIIEALVKSYGDNLQGLEISKDGQDLRLILKGINTSENTSHVLVLQKFFTQSFPSEDRNFVYEPSPEKYKCKDTFEIFDSDSFEKENVRINGINMTLSDSLYDLLLYLADAVKNTEAGWVYIQDLKNEGIIASDGYQPFSRLRNALAGFLLKRNPQDAIESNGRKQYRLSVDPKNISIPAK